MEIRVKVRSFYERARAIGFSTETIIPRAQIRYSDQTGQKNGISKGTYHKVFKYQDPAKHNKVGDDIVSIRFEILDALAWALKCPCEELIDPTHREGLNYIHEVINGAAESEIKTQKLHDESCQIDVNRLNRIIEDTIRLRKKQGKLSFNQKDLAREIGISNSLLSTMMNEHQAKFNKHEVQLVESHFKLSLQKNESLTPSKESRKQPNPAVHLDWLANDNYLTDFFYIAPKKLSVDLEVIKLAIKHAKRDAKFHEFVAQVDKIIEGFKSDISEDTNSIKNETRGAYTDNILELVEDESIVSELSPRNLLILSAYLKIRPSTLLVKGLQSDGRLRELETQHLQKKQGFKSYALKLIRKFGIINGK